MTPKTKTLIVLLVSFLLGCIVGASMLSGVWRSMTRQSSHKDGYRAYLYERLALDSVQIGSVDSLLDAFRTSLTSYRESVRDSRDSLRMEIRQLLNETQRIGYDAMVAEMDRRESTRRQDSLRTK